MKAFRCPQVTHWRYHIGILPKVSPWKRFKKGFKVKLHDVIGHMTVHHALFTTCGGEVQSEEDRFSAGHSRREGNYLISYWCTGVTCRINK